MLDLVTTLVSRFSGRTKPVRAEDVSSLARELLAADDPPRVIGEKIKSLREDNRQGIISQLYDELIAQDCSVPIVYINRLAELRAFLGSHVPVNRRTRLQRQLAFVLEKALTKLGDEIVAEQQLHYRLAQASLEMGEQQNAVRVARRLVVRVTDPRFSREIARMVSLVPNTEDSKSLLALAEQLFGIAPDKPEVALLYLNQLRAGGAPRQAQFEMLQRALTHNPNNVGILTNLARCALGRDRSLALEADAEKYAARLVEIHPKRESYSIYGRILLLRGKQAEALAVFKKITVRFDPAVLGALSASLSELCALCNKNYYYDSKVDLGTLRNTLTQSRQRLDAFLAASETITADELESAARRLNGFNELFLKFARLMEVSEELGEQLGTLDPAPFAAISYALREHVLTILEHGLSERVLSRPIKGQEIIRNLASMYTSISLALGQPGKARERLETLASAGLAENVADFLQTARMFDEFEANNEFVAKIELGAARWPAELNQMAHWDRWTTAQGLPPQVMVTAPEQKGCFSIVSADGTLHEKDCGQQEFRLERVAAGEVTLRNSELLVGPKGLLFKASAIHGHYPPSGLPCLVSNTPNSVCLRASQSRLRIEEPVIILANNNVAWSNNYGHWLIFLLTRLNAVVDSGVLGGRKLLLPVEMTSWMKETLALIGLPDDRMILYPRDCDTIAADAEIISPIDAWTGNLIPQLRAKMYARAGANNASNGTKRTPYLYLARKTQQRRLILDEDKVYRVVEKAGYSIISPETLMVAGQVRLFSQAKAIAGPGGSAFANMIFCKSGTRALCIRGEGKVSPLGLDLAIANGIDFRWLLGKSVRSLAQFTNPLDVPFEVDLNSLERHLAWAAEASTS